MVPVGCSESRPSAPDRRPWGRSPVGRAFFGAGRLFNPAELERRPPPVLPVGARHTGPPSAARRAFRIADSPPGGNGRIASPLSTRGRCRVEAGAPLSGAHRGVGGDGGRTEPTAPKLECQYRDATRPGKAPTAAVPNRTGETRRAGPVCRKRRAQDRAMVGRFAEGQTASGRQDRAARQTRDHTCPLTTEADRERANGWLRKAILAGQYLFQEGDQRFPRKVWYRDGEQDWMGWCFNTRVGEYYKGWPISEAERCAIFG